MNVKGWIELIEAIGSVDPRNLGLLIIALAICAVVWIMQ